jgi:subtilisin family serine protease
VYSFDGRDFGTNVDGPDHGTMAASCAAGNMHGIAKKASIYNLRYNWSNFEGAKALDAMYAHYQAGDKPAVLSMSFGSSSNIYDQIFNELAASGVVLVAAAGNYDTPYATFPARRSDVIAVAACDEQLRPSIWGGGQATNYGPEVDIWAGGTSGTAASIMSTTDTQWAGGTSSACPIVAGAMALFLEGSGKLESYSDVLGAKNKLLAHSRVGVVDYTDDKYAFTANRYVYTLGEIVEPEPAPEPTPDTKEKSSNLPLILSVLVVIGLIAAFAI